jgi:hypothetical protein
MRASRTSGFVRGAPSNMRPYRDLYPPRFLFLSGSDACCQPG